MTTNSIHLPVENTDEKLVPKRRQGIGISQMLYQSYQLLLLLLQEIFVSRCTWEQALMLTFSVTRLVFSVSRLIPIVQLIFYSE